MHLKFLHCQQMFCCFSVKNMGCKPTLCLLFCEVVYRTGISNHWLLLCVHFSQAGAASSKSHWLFNLHLQKSQLGEFQHIGLIANISSMHHAGPSSSTLYQIIIINWSDKQRKPYWLNESKYLWNVSMCPFVLHALNSIVAKHWHMLIIGSSQLTVLLTPLNLSLINLKMQNLFSDTWFRVPILQFMLDLELTSLKVRLSAPNFAQRRRTVSWSQRTQ